MRQTLSVASILLAATLIGGVFASSCEAQETKAKKVEKGKAAPDFTMTGIDGKSFKLSDRTGKDKNIIIMFSRANW